jgi:Transcriptional regulators
METRKLKSIEDIALLAGVSKSTVSRALNDSPLVGIETKERIKAIAKQHDFKPSFAARNLSLKTSRTIAYVNFGDSEDCCGLTDPFGAEIMGGIAVGLHELGFDLLMVHADPRDEAWASFYLDTGRVDGFILITSTKKRSQIERLMEIGAPFVVWGTSPGTYCSVCGDDVQGGSLAAARLASQGRKNIAFLGGMRAEAEVKLRYEGYAKAMETAGLDPKRLVAYADYDERLAEKAVEDFLQREPDLDGICSNSDYMAIAAMRVLKRRGRHIPEDVAVIGYDDLSIASYVSPALTTVSQCIAQAGRILAKSLVSYIERGIITNTVMPVELVVRESA